MTVSATIRLARRSAAIKYASPSGWSRQKELIRAALQGSLPPQSHAITCRRRDDYLNAKKATANTQRAIEFDRERLEVVKRVFVTEPFSVVMRE